MKAKHGKRILIVTLGFTLVFSTGVAASSTFEDRITQLETKHEKQLIEQKQIAEDYEKQLIEINKIVEKTSIAEDALTSAKQDIKDVTKKIKTLDKKNDSLIEKNEKLLDEVEQLKKELH